MRCPKCDERFSAGPRVFPGGKAAPGVFLGIGGLFLVGGAVIWFLPDLGLKLIPRYWTFVGAVIALFCFVQIPIAMGDNKTYGQAENVIICPGCETPVPIRPWSL